jgi:hypothetical protein
MIVLASANRLTDTPDAIAVCPDCRRYFDEKEWKIPPRVSGIQDSPF